jgi:hypothetical protein
MKEESNIGGDQGTQSNTFDRSEYQKDYMRRKREREKVLADRVARLAGLSETDRAFDKAKPDYFLFREKSEERKCWNCSDTFETQLELNKFCSPQCKEEFLHDSLKARQKS